jgi:AraC-like DNA-binding protein
MRESAVFIWNDRALFVGDRSETAVHSHNAIELALGLDEAGIEMAAPNGPDLRGVPGALVRSNALHRLAIPGPKVAVLYVDARSPFGAGLHAWLGERDIAELPPCPRERLRALFRDDHELAHAREVTDAVLKELVPTTEMPPFDARIARALALLDARLASPPTQAEAASEVGLSPSRFGHLFKAQVGLPMRRYILWMRLRAALTEAMGRGDMTRAAHAAGFADAAHFTRTCRRMFGLPPTAFAPVDAAFVAPVDDQNVQDGSRAAG